MNLILLKKNINLNFYNNFSYNFFIFNIKLNLKKLIFLPFFSNLKIKKNLFFFFNKSLLKSINIKLKQAYNEFKTGYFSELIAIGVGYKFERLKKKNNFLVLNVGYSHYIYYLLNKYITFRTTKNYLFLFSINLRILKLNVNEIRKYKIPDPYKGKGIRFLKQKIKLKPGKKKR